MVEVVSWLGFSRLLLETGLIIFVDAVIHNGGNRKSKSCKETSCLLMFKKMHQIKLWRASSYTKTHKLTQHNTSSEKEKGKVLDWTSQSPDLKMVHAFHLLFIFFLLQISLKLSVTHSKCESCVTTLLSCVIYLIKVNYQIKVEIWTLGHIYSKNKWSVILVLLKWTLNYY